MTAALVLDPALRDELLRLRAVERAIPGGCSRQAARARTDEHMIAMQSAGWDRATIASLVGVQEEEIRRRTSMGSSTRLGMGEVPPAVLVCEPCARQWPSEVELVDHWNDDHEDMP